MPAIGDIDLEFDPLAVSGGEGEEVDNAASGFQDAMAASFDASRDRAPSSRNQPSNSSASHSSSASYRSPAFDPSRAPHASVRGVRPPEYPAPSGFGRLESSQLAAPSPRHGPSGDSVHNRGFGPMATGARFSAAPDHPPRLLSPLSRTFVDNLTLEGLFGTHIRDLTHQVNQNREAYTFDDQGYSAASVEDYVERRKQTINSLRNRVFLKNDEPVADILGRNNVPIEDTANVFAHLEVQGPRGGRGHLRSLSHLPPLGAPTEPDPRYANPDELPGPSAQNAVAGTQMYGSVTVHGGPGAWTAYQNVREFATQPGSAHDQGRDVIATLENSSDQVHMYPYKIRQGMTAKNYMTPVNIVHVGPQGRLSEIVFSDNQGLLAPNGSRVPPAAIALHEMEHVKRAKYDLGPLEREHMGNLTNRDEYEVINGAEGAALDAMGIPRRDSHKSDTFYQTTGPTSVTATNPVVEAIQRTAVPELRRLTTRLVHVGVDQSRPPAWFVGEAGNAQWDRDLFAYVAAQAIAAQEGRQTLKKRGRSPSPELR
jgi:hypothetical protein